MSECVCGLISVCLCAVVCCQALVSRDLLDVYLEALELGEGDDDAISNASIRSDHISTDKSEYIYT